MWPDDVKWSTLPDGTPYIKAFRFLVGMRDISSSVQQQETTLIMREVASRYPTYNVTTFMPLWLFTGNLHLFSDCQVRLLFACLDQYAIVVPNTIQNIIIAIIVMIIIAVLLIPQPMCALWIALAIGSIDIGVIGFMTLWDVKLVTFFFKLTLYTFIHIQF